MFSSEAWLAKSGGFYNGVATQSLRFDDGSSTYLTRTPSSEGNRRTWTASFWVKRSDFNTSQAQNILTSGVVNSTDLSIFFDTNATFGLYSRDGGYVTTNRLFRDSSAWYHIVVAFDTTQGTASNRVKIYVNGTQETSFGNSTYPDQNSQKSTNDDVLHRIGNRDYSSAYNYFGGYLAEFNLIDGTALTPASFGETKNGVWIPIEYTGSYGTNGFRLQFNQTGTGTASASTIGADTSGNTNHWTSSGIVASDCSLLDSPENNFCTMNALDNGGNGGVTLTEGNLKTATASNDWDNVRSTFVMPTGSWYVELLSTSGIGNGNTFIGIIPQDEPIPSSFFGSVSTSWGYSSNGNWYNNNGAGGNGATYSATDIVGMSFDGSTLKFYKNNSLQITIGSLPSRKYSVAISLYDTDESCILNFGQDPTFTGIQDSSTAGKTPSNSADENGNGLFFYAPPSGFLALCSSNLPEPTISPNADTQADDYFNTVLYTGNGGSHALTGVGFQPDWIWIKNRTSSVDYHNVYDSSRGTPRLYPNDTNAEETGHIVSYDTDGFTLNTNNTNSNASSTSYVAWNWKANGGTTSSNTDGSITSTVQANTTAGFSIVTYTGTGSSGATYGHGLTQAPQIVITKERNNTRRWVVVTRGIGITDYQGRYLDDTLAFNDQSYNISNISSTLITLGADQTNDSSSSTYVAYCFHSVEGYSKFGSYTGNGNADGTFVYTGFRPAFLIVKRTDNTGNWFVLDSVRDPENATPYKILYPNLSNAEDSSGGFVYDLLSNGFKFRNTEGDVNASGGTYIYMAFAENPFKYANAR